MRGLLKGLLLLSLAGWVSGCSHGHHSQVGFRYGFVNLDHDTVVIRVKGYDEAQVTPQGELLLGGRPQAVSPQARAALSRYNAAGRQFVDRSLQLGLDSAGFALHTAGEAFKGVLHGDTDGVGAAAEQGKRSIEAKARDLCQSLRDWRSAQDAATAATPEFRPYAVIEPQDRADCQAEVGGGGKT